MTPNKVETVLEAVLAVALIVGALAYLRVQGASLKQLAPKVDPRASEIYQQRMRATEVLLKSDGHDVRGL